MQKFHELIIPSDKRDRSKIRISLHTISDTPDGRFGIVLSIKLANCATSASSAIRGEVKKD